MNRGLNLHSLPFLITSLLFFVFPLFVLLKNKKSLVVRRFFILGLSATAWQLPYFIGYNLSDETSIFFWYKIAYVALVFISPAIYHFIASLLNLKRTKLTLLFYSISFIFAYFVIRSDYIIKGIRKFPWGSCSVPGSAYTAFLILWVVPCILALLNLYREYRKTTSPYTKKRIKFFVVTLSIAYLAVVDSFSVQGIRIYPFGFIPLIFFGISTTYAIIHYRLLDIEIVIKKASLIVFGFILSVSIIYISALYLQPYFYNLLQENWVLFPVLVSLMVGCGLFRFVNFVKRIQESELSKKFSYRPILKKEAQRISAARTTNELLIYLIRDLSCWVRLDYVGIFILDAQSKHFFLARDISRTKNRNKMPKNLALSYDDILIKEVLKKRKAVIRSELEYLINTSTISARDKKHSIQIIQEMEQLNAEISIPSFCEGRLLAVINIGHKLNRDEIITNEDLDIFTSLSNSIGRALHGFMLQKEKTRLIVASQNTIISAIEAKDSYTRGHTDRVAHYTRLIGQELKKHLHNLSHGFTSLNWSAQLHDVGKIGIPDSILFKSDPLTEEEWQKIRQHPFEGIKIISPVREWLGEDICAGILHHHENFDGTGYPSGLKGEEIHIFARIIRIADAFDAMTSDRPYRSAFSSAAALKELNRYKGMCFDPLIVDVLETIHRRGQI